MGAPGGNLLGAIPTQKMESPAKNAPQGWRPSPGYRPSKAGDPTPPPATPKKQGGGGGRGDPGVPWETAPQRAQRVISEQAYNKKFDANNAPGRKVMVGGELVNAQARASGSGKQLTQAEADARKARMQARRTDYTATKARAEAAYNAPSNKAQRWSDANRNVGEIREGRMGGAVRPTAPKRGPVTIEEKVQRMQAAEARSEQAPQTPRVRPSASVAGGNARWK
jgi:hypothetical protein